MQSRVVSLIEAWTNTLIGFLINVCLGPFVYPIFGATFTMWQNVRIALFFTIVSVLRGYCVRRGFNHLRYPEKLRDTSFD